MSRIRVQLLLTALVVCAACSERTSEHVDRMMVLSPTPLRTFCADSVPIENCQWRRALFIKRSSNGDVAVLDGPTTLYLFRPSGEGRLIGREGRGPGEFQFIADFAIGDSSEITVYDVRQFRADILDRQGRSLQTSGLAFGDELSDIKVLPGRVAFLVVESGDSLAAKVSGSIDVHSIDGAAQSLSVRITTRAQRVKGSEFQPIPKPFAPKVLWDINRQGDIAIGYGDDEEITIHHADGSGKTKVQLFWQTEAVSQLERDSVERAITRLGGRPSTAPGYEARAVELLKQLPARHALSDELILLDGGELLVHRAGTSNGMARWEMFAPSGNHIGSLALARTDRLAYVLADTVGVLHESSDGALSLSEYTMKPSNSLPPTQQP